MKIKTKYFDEITYEEGDILSIPGGLFGFEKYTKFLTIPFNESNDSMISLQSLDNPELSFILMNPFQLYNDYSPILSAEDLGFFKGTKEEDLSYYVIAVLKDTLADSTINLKAPLVLNAMTRTGIQVILDQEEYKFRHKFPSIQSKEV